MEFRQLTHDRRSVRFFDRRDVTDVDLGRIVSVAQSAPSAGNLQAYRLVVVRDARHRERLSEAAHEQRAITHAPVAIVFLADTERSAARYGQRGAALFALQDATIAAAYAQLAAQDLGLATVWIGAFDDAQVQLAVHAEPGLRPICVLAIGHAAENPEAPERRPAYEIVRAERADGAAW